MRLRGFDLDPKTSLGTTALLASIAGLMTCGFLSPLALVLSVAALARPPRRHAWTALAVSAAGVASLLALLRWLSSRPAS